MNAFPSKQNDSNAKSAKNEESTYTSRTHNKNDEIAQCNKKESKHKQKVSWPDWIVAICTIVIVAIMFFYTKFAAQQVDETRRAIKQVGEQFALGQRPWLHVEPAGGYPARGQPTQIAIIVKNAGKTPAYNVTSAIICEKNTVPDYAKENSEPEPQLIIQPGQSRWIKKDSNFAENVLADAEHFYVHGIIRYSDMFEKDHWITFCFIYDTRAHDFYTTYKEHNDIDSN